MRSVEGITMLVVCNMCLILTVSSIVSIPLLHVVMVVPGKLIAIQMKMIDLIVKTPTQPQLNLT